jgi:hypothetical protein
MRWKALSSLNALDRQPGHEDAERDKVADGNNNAPVHGVEVRNMGEEVKK